MPLLYLLLLAQGCCNIHQLIEMERLDRMKLKDIQNCLKEILRLDFGTCLENCLRFLLLKSSALSIEGFSRSYTFLPPPLTPCLFFWIVFLFQSPWHFHRDPSRLWRHSLVHSLLCFCPQDFWLYFLEFATLRKSNSMYWLKYQMLIKQVSEIYINEFYH